MEDFRSNSLTRPIHVYLSFKGDDEARDFTDRLWAALESDDLNTFWDDKKLEPVDSSIPPHFLKAIQQSSVAIVVFSKNYASSMWCLEELSRIAARIHDSRYTAFPVFYDVDPSEVQDQSDSYEKAFAEHEQRFAANFHKVRSWRSAMKQVATLSGSDVPHNQGPQVIDDMVKRVKRKMRDLVYADADLVGIQSRVREVEKLLHLGSNDTVRVVGICGMGGTGKTTLARVLYDKLSGYFDASYFLSYVRQLNEIMSPGHHKSTLLVLDSDMCRNQPQWFRIRRIYKCLGGGSRIIITTRDETVLKRFEMYDIYRVELLTKNEALQLFCRKAFKLNFPLEGYEEQINSVLEYADGLPLAIVTVGSFLYNRRAPEWSIAFKAFKKVNSLMIMKVLKQSFDELDYCSKEMFLDIACFFIGKEIKSVEGILQGCGWPAKYGIQLLIEKSLMTITDEKIQTHTLLREMGREIVRHRFPNRPKKWSRLWDFNDFYRVMQDDTDICEVQAVVLDLDDSERRTISIEALSSMNNLRLLIFRNVKFSGVLNHLPKMLEYISWHQYPFACLPSSFEPIALIELSLPDSCITNIWEGQKTLFCLRNINLRGCKNLIKLPDFRGLPNLEKLDLEGCTKLSQLDPSIAGLAKLRCLNLRNCIDLVSIPNHLFSLSSLEIINMACCSKFAHCLKYCPFEEIAESSKTFKQSFPCKRQKLCRQKSV